VLFSNISGPTDSYAEVRIAFDFDAFMKYTNGTNVKPLSFSVPLNIQSVPGVMSYDPRLYPHMVIKVNCRNKGRQMLSLSFNN